MKIIKYVIDGLISCIDSWTGAKTDISFTQSMSRKGNSLDNSVMENFFGRMKTEMFYGYRFESLDELKQEIHDYIFYYNNKRIKSKLKGLSPIEFRTQSYSYI